MAEEEAIHPEHSSHPGPSTQTETERNPGPNSEPSGLPKSSCSHSKTGRNLVVCIDGTANQFGVNVSIPFDTSHVLRFTGFSEH